MTDKEDKDLEDIPPQIARKIDFHLVKHISEVINLACRMDHAKPPSVTRAVEPAGPLAPAVTDDGVQTTNLAVRDRSAD